MIQNGPKSSKGYSLYSCPFLFPSGPMCFHPMCSPHIKKHLRPSLSQSEKMGKTRLLYPGPFRAAGQFCAFEPTKVLKPIYVRSGEHLLHLKKTTLTPTPFSHNRLRKINLSLN
ncbi:beta-1,4-galactosyltransferase 4 [Platysternon megacephalum]|uniref:Beta-1,4-galactosyltransferase 4 n=1 Tax=Platysternon megacephalum TaxID=55544 RepID=A0A4D9EHY1_9SAUR|nr:beta-1,4-galactosyltransferase 4 [Platysternon megacephalum]